MPIYGDVKNKEEIDKIMVCNYLLNVLYVENCKYEEIRPIVNLYQYIIFIGDMPAEHKRINSGSNFNFISMANGNMAYPTQSLIEKGYEALFTKFVSEAYGNTYIKPEDDNYFKILVDKERNINDNLKNEISILRKAIAADRELLESYYKTIADITKKIRKNEKLLAFYETDSCISIEKIISIANSIKNIKHINTRDNKLYLHYFTKVLNSDKEVLNILLNNKKSWYYEKYYSNTFLKIFKLFLDGKVNIWWNTIFCIDLANQVFCSVRDGSDKNALMNIHIQGANCFGTAGEPLQKLLSANNYEGLFLQLDYVASTLNGDDSIIINGLITKLCECNISCLEYKNKIYNVAELNNLLKDEEEQEQIEKQVKEYAKELVKNETVEN